MLVREITRAKATIFRPGAWSHCIYIALPCAIYRTCSFLRVCTNFNVKSTLAFLQWFYNQLVICLVMSYCQKAGLLKRPLIWLPHLFSWGQAAEKIFQNLLSSDIFVRLTTPLVVVRWFLSLHTFSPLAITSFPICPHLHMLLIPQGTLVFLFIQLP